MDYDVTIPGHQAHPPKCNWHIEKDGIIVAKGNGILKYAGVNSYYRYDHYMKDMEEFKKMTKEEYIAKYMNDTRYNHYSDKEQDRKIAESHYNKMLENKKLMDEFETFIRKIDSTCGGMLGNCEFVQYEKIKVTEYKTENRAIETTTGSIKDGQCFILKANFSYGCHKGLVYRIHESEYEGKKYYTAYKLNGKLTKECTGNANRNNQWYIGSGVHDNLTKWIEKGSIAWCEIREVKIPYEVEKVVKKVIKTEQEEQPEATNINNLHYDIKEDIDTRNNSKIYVVKVVEKLDKEEYIKVNNYMKSIGGYYSKFKHGFIFKNDPTLLLNNNIEQSNITTQDPQEKTEQFKKPEEKPINFDIEQKNNIWLVKIKDNLSKDKFAEVKRHFATLKGFYSGQYSSFVFKYDPREVIMNT